MNVADFSDLLQREGFSTLVEVNREAGGMMERHTHAFHAKGLILDGELRLTVDGEERLYRAGDIFELGHEEHHVEHYGPQGVRYLVGRK